MFYYKVQFMEHDEIKNDKGICVGDDYGMAADMVNRYYPDVISLNLEQWEDVITEDDIKEDFHV